MVDKALEDIYYCYDNDRAKAALAALQSAGPEIAAKARLLAEQGIPDPFGGGPQAYDRAYAAIEQAVKALLDRLEQEDGQ